MRTISLFFKLHLIIRRQIDTVANLCCKGTVESTGRVRKYGTKVVCTFSGCRATHFSSAWGRVMSRASPSPKLSLPSDTAIVPRADKQMLRSWRNLLLLALTSSTWKECADPL